jgi:cell division protein FtsN
VWVSYLLLSVALIAFLLFEAGVLASPLSTMRLPRQPEERYLAPRPLRRLVRPSSRPAEPGAPSEKEALHPDRAEAERASEATDSGQHPSPEEEE